MGSSQSSHAKSKSPGSKLPESVRGRKSIITNKEAPHGLKSSVVSVHSELLNALTIDAAEPTMRLADDEKLMTSSLDVSETESECEEEDLSDDEEDEEWEERLRILEDARQLKEVANFFLHPEKPVSSKIAVTRCFFDRPAAPEMVSKDEANERAAILADTSALKQVAVDYMHPEKPVVGAEACCRNFFSRPSAATSETPEEATERARILEDCIALKNSAVQYMHPELPVTTTDATACGRNFFSRPSAPQDVEERAAIMADIVALKQAAADYMHPERPVSITDPFSCGRNYFSRASAPEQESLEEAEERARVMEDLKALKQAAVDYLHPELPVVTTDPFACGRNFFSRASAADQESTKEATECSQILADAEALKKTAVDYMHPELPVRGSGACARNFFTRFGAPDQESPEEAAAREDVLQDAANLKQLAVDFMHPELPVVIYATATGRNYFGRPSAPEQESLEEVEERVRILEEAKALKQTAVDYMHPELPVVTSDPSACGRNFFSRPSAPLQEDVEAASERAAILADAAALKRAAIDYLHPELPVVTSDPTACARNFFSRPAASEQEDSKVSEERARIMAEAKALKKLAVDYMHPELPVKTTDPTATGRNYFDRPSSRMHEQMIHTFPPHEDDLSEHEHVDHFGMDEELEDLDLFAERLRNNIVVAPEQQQQVPNKTYAGSDVGSNLSRSPSSVMLFTEESVYD